MAKNTTAKHGKQALVVTVSGDRGIHKVADDLRAGGFKVNQVLEAIGVVTGSADAKRVAQLRRISGVSDVSPDHDVNIGPPDSPIS
jgi:hypothetical protein